MAGLDNAAPDVHYEGSVGGVGRKHRLSGGVQLKLNKFLAVAFVAAVSFSSFAVSAAPAGADEGFEFTYFPHQGLDNEFSNDWGRPRDDGDRSHKGNDVFAPKLTPVVAVADGFVTFVGTGKRPGNQVRIRHANGWETWYFHLNNDIPGTDNGRGGAKFAFAEGLARGDFVAAGTIIGYVGDSGNAEATPPHTHFELHHNGKAQNPYRHLRSAQRRQERVYELFDSLEFG